MVMNRRQEERQEEKRRNRRKRAEKREEKDIQTEPTDTDTDTYAKKHRPRRLRNRANDLRQEYRPFFASNIPHLRATNHSPFHSALASRQPQQHLHHPIPMATISNHLTHPSKKQRPQPTEDHIHLQITPNRAHLSSPQKATTARPTDRAPSRIPPHASSHRNRA
ncbi:hypothetical protein M422DRAFT_244816 [Sphaerobolus stellatus SS14]|nr:hypothetical protein M422DRAFT_244816 [Sphaerobolus stellatus SS14]